MQTTIVTPTELKELNCIRQLGQHVSDDKIQAYIFEVEMLYIKPVIGDDLYLQLLDGEEECKCNTACLLGGGIYTDKCGKRKCFSGLRTAIAYFVYAQYIMSGDAESTRYGFVVKNGDYSQRISSKERSDAYNNVLQIAQGYLDECKQYMREVMGVCRSGNPKISGGMQIRKIG